MNLDDINRRRFVRNTGLGALLFQVGGATQLLSPREAHAAEIPLQHLDRGQASLLSAFADHLLPGAAAAGVAHFVDQQLGVEPNECLLMCKYFPAIRAPFIDFYTGGLITLANNIATHFNGEFVELGDAEKNALTDSLWRGDISPWTGPPPPLFYMMLRSDAVDVVYGSKEGFDMLNVPYMAHIAPPEKW